LTLDGAPFVVAGTSYYPRQASWDEFWPTYDPGRTEADLALMRSLGLNTVRIFVPFFDISDDEALAKMVADLTDFLDQADAAGMKVIVTLFDHRTDHHPANWAADGRYLAALIPPFAQHRTLLAWDLKNEANLDYPLHGAALVDQWLLYVAREIRRYDAGHLLTVGWSSPEAAANPTVAAVTDLISYHYLDPAEAYPQRAGALRAALPDHPLLLGEFGLSTWDALFPGGHTEAEQAVHYASILRSHRELESVGYLSWTLYDYTRVNLAQFRTPWQRATQANMGVVRVDDSLKPAAALLRPQADLDLPALPSWHRFTKRFWRAVAVITLWILFILVWRYRRRRSPL
jgi:endo-1,4-beta-mannosidase